MYISARTVSDDEYRKRIFDPLIDDVRLTVEGAQSLPRRCIGARFVIAFARASDAVACTLQLQRAALAPIRLRIGVHTGEVQLRDEGNYIGPTINRTARLRDLAHGGQTVLSGITGKSRRRPASEGAFLTDLGSQPLRDLPRPERVMQLCHPDLQNEHPPLRTSKVGEANYFPVRSPVSRPWGGVRRGGRAARERQAGNP